MIRHYRITVKGRVQGVFFRAFVLEQAGTLGIKGFVMNTAEGNVYIEAEGNGEQLDELLRWCRKGSPLSDVKSVDLEEGEPQQFETFLIRR